MSCQWLTVKEASAEFKMDPATIRRWARDGMLCALVVKVGKHWTYRICKQLPEKMVTGPNVRIG